MLPSPLIFLFGTVILIWLGVLTVLFVRIFAHYKNLLKGINEGNLEKVLRKILEREDLSRREIFEIKTEILGLKKRDLKHLQRVGFVRFNPFNETGGDNSFTLCLLDDNYDGLVITGLHTREKTRMYAKRIQRGVSKYELSKEEKRAVSEAIK